MNVCSHHAPRDEVCAFLCGLALAPPIACRAAAACFFERLMSARSASCCSLVECAWHTNTASRRSEMTTLHHAPRDVVCAFLCGLALAPPIACRAAAACFFELLMSAGSASCCSLVGCAWHTAAAS